MTISVEQVATGNTDRVLTAAAEPAVQVDISAHHPSTLVDALVLHAALHDATAIDLQEIDDAGEVRVAVKRRKRSIARAIVPRDVGRAMMARLCLLAGLDLIADRAQTGRFLVRTGERLLDVFVLSRHAPSPAVEVKILDDNAGAAAPSLRDRGAALPNVLAPGTAVGAYRVIDIAGRGGMGIVYRGEHAMLARPVAIKVLDRKLLLEDPDAARRFYLEARAAARIHHEGIVDVFDVSTLADGRPYLVMELLEGKSLTEIIEEAGPLPLARVAALGQQIAAALAAAHDRGVSHHDITPGNVFVQDGESGERIKLVDFGAAQLAGAQLPAKASSMVIGTPWYMAPEQARGTTCDARSDIYSLGVLLFELVTGSVPFSGETPREVLIKHLIEEPPAMWSPHGPIPDALATIVAKMLRKNPADRFASATEVAEALGRLDLSRRFRFRWLS